MRATLSTTTFDPLGYVEIDVLPESAFQERRRRTNRIATLDGSAVFNEFGYTEADKTIVLRWTVRDQVTEDAVDRLTRLYSRLNLSIDRGAWLVATEFFTPGAAESRLTLLVVEKISP
jgi:hypothetical protein